MTTKSLWGHIDVGTAPPSPVVILQGQASKLEEITKGLLTANIERSQSGSRFNATLEVIAPYLYNYRLEVLEINYPPEVFPVTVRDLVSDKTRTSSGLSYQLCDTEEQFLRLLGEILGASKLLKILAALVSHSQTERSQAQSNTMTAF